MARKVRDVIELIEADGWYLVVTKAMHRFLIVVERAERNYSAYSPDLPGCVATGKTREQATRNMHEAIELHVRGLREDRLPIPKSRSYAEYVAVP